MAIILVVAAFTILILYELPRFIKNKEPIRLYIIYILIMATSFIVSILLAGGKRPVSPAKIIEGMLQTIGVIN